METLWRVLRSRRGRRRRLWVLAGGALAVVIAVVVLFMSGRGPSNSTSSGAGALQPSPRPALMPAPESPVTAASSTAPPAQSRAPGEPVTLDYRKLSLAAADAIYTWDTRTSSYTEVYSRLRAWWNVLPDGSNPVDVFVQEFEDTGVNAGSFASLTGQKAYRTANAANARCDQDLALVRVHPVPWTGPHVCTMTVNVVEHATSGTNAYTVPVSVMVNCPPAITAPPDRCVMVAFYTTPSRIVY